MRDVLLSIHPQFVKQIEDGTKKIELRRRFPEVPSGTKVWIYSTAPVKKIVASFQVAAVRKVDSDEIVNRHAGAICLPAEAVREYLSGLDSAYIIEIQDVEKIDAGPSMSDMKNQGIRPPQNYQYLDPRRLRMLGLGWSSASLDESR